MRKNLSADASRDVLFDNLKALMLILVALGHILDPYIEQQDSLYRYLMQYIYLFHMPMFAFITDYFTKNTEKARHTAVQKVLLPYLFWQILYCLVAVACIMLGLASYNSSVFRPSLLLPTSPLYYLLCVFVWKLTAHDMKRMRTPVLLLFAGAAGLGISTISNGEFHIGWGACLSLLIFFVLGLNCTEQHIQKIRSIPHAVAIAILLIAVVPATLLPYSFRNVRFTYASVELSNAAGIAYRLLFYAIAILMILALINLFPAKKNIFSRIGTNSLLVYAGSSFASPTLYLLIARFVPVAVHPVVNLLCMIIFSIAVTWFCSMDWIKNVYDWIMGKIQRILFLA